MSADVGALHKLGCRGAKRRIHDQEMKQQNVNNKRHLIGCALLPSNKDICQCTEGTRLVATCSHLLQVFLRTKLHYEPSHLPAAIGNKALVLTLCRLHLCLHLRDAGPDWRGDINHGVPYVLVSGRGVHTGENDTVQGREGEGCGRKSNLQQDVG